MSDKKDDHGKDGHGGDHDKKPGGLAKMGKMVLLVIGGLLLAVLLFRITEGLLPELFNGSTGVIRATRQGMSTQSVEINMLGISLGMWMTGWTSLIFRLLMYVILFAVAGWGLQLLLSKLRGGDRGHGNEHH